MWLLLGVLLNQQVSEPPVLEIVPLDTVAERYRQCDGKEIVLAGIVTFGPEGNVIHLPAPKRSGQREAIFVQLPLQPNKPNPELEAKILEQGENAWQRRCGSAWSIPRE